MVVLHTFNPSTGSKCKGRWISELEDSPGLPRETLFQTNKTKQANRQKPMRSQILFSACQVLKIMKYILHLQNISIGNTLTTKAKEQQVAISYCVAKYRFKVQSTGSQPVVTTSFGVIYQISCTSNIYIRIQNSRKVIVIKQQQNNFMFGGHHNMRSYIKGSQHQEG